ncbi:MAG: NUDIX domain-containing protein [Bdellovibrionales bacterium]
MTEGFAQPIRPLAVDAIIVNEAGAVLLIQRRDPPFAGYYALPGGMVDVGETVEQACCREVKEEVGLDITEDMIELVGIASDPARDPRRNTISAVYLVRYNGAAPAAGDDATTAAFYADWQQKDMAFDHGKILRDALLVKQKAA